MARTVRDRATVGCDLIRRRGCRGTETDSARWRVLRDGDDEVRRLTHERVQIDTDSGRWVTHVWVIKEAGRVYGVVRSGPVNPEGVVTTLRFQAFRPRIVGDWIAQLDVVRDGQRLSTRAMIVGLGDADPLSRETARPVGGGRLASWSPSRTGS